MRAKTFHFGRTQAFIGTATHFGWCINWHTTEGHWAKTETFPLSRWVPDTRQVDIYVPFVFFGIKWEGQGGLL